MAVDGLLMVPLHIVALRAAVVLDPGRRCGRVDATMEYQVGPASGCPFFDLRQPIDRAWLDGRPLATAGLRSRQVGEGPAATVRLIDVPQDAASTHTLRLRYRLGRPLSDHGGAYPPVLAARGHRKVRWSFGMADLFDGRHLEMWFPATLPFDQFPFDLELRLVGDPVAHTPITNGTVRSIGLHAWHIAFPAWFTSLSPMLELRPADEVEQAGGRLTTGPGRVTAVDVWKPTGAPEDLRRQAARLAQLLGTAAASFGPALDDRYTCFFHGADGGMEYAGATTTSPAALAHEVLHSWFARGVMPASDADGWWDEAFTTYTTSGAAPVALDFGRPPTVLCSRRPFQRHTPAAAYEQGSRVFGGIAALIGPAALRTAMRRLFASHRRRCLSTAELEEHLVRQSGEVRIVDVFHRFVYGFEDPEQPCPVGVDAVRCRPEPGGQAAVAAIVSLPAGATECRHFVLTFAVRSGADRVRPTRPGPAAVVAGFDLRPGERRTVGAQIEMSGPAPSVGEGRLDLVAAVHTRGASPVARSVVVRSGPVTGSGIRPAAAHPVPAGGAADRAGRGSSRP